MLVSPQRTVLNVQLYRENYAAFADDSGTLYRRLGDKRVATNLLAIPKFYEPPECCALENTHSIPIICEKRL